MSLGTVSNSIQWHGDGLVAQALLSYARMTPGHPTKLRLFRSIVRRFFPDGLPLRSIWGARVRVDVADYIGHSICVSGAYEPISICLALELMRTGGTFVDIGSNFGLYTCSVGRVSGVRVVAIDPSPVANAKLQENIRLNSLDSVTMVGAAIQSARGLVHLEAPVAGNLGTARTVAGPFGRLRGGCVVPALPLDEILFSLGVEAIRLLKVDVEGAEFEVLQGLDLVARYRPDDIIMESVTGSSGFEACRRLLEDSGYEARFVTGEVFATDAAIPEANIWWTRRGDAGARETNASQVVSKA